VGKTVGRYGAQRESSRLLRGRAGVEVSIDVVARGWPRKRKTPRLGTLMQINVKLAGETKDPHRVGSHDRVPTYVLHRAHEPIPELAKLASELYRRVFDPQLARGAQGVVEYRPRHRVVVVGMCGIQLAGELDQVPELDAVALSAVFGKVGL